MAKGDFFMNKLIKSSLLVVSMMMLMSCTASPTSSTSNLPSSDTSTGSDTGHVESTSTGDESTSVESSSETSSSESSISVSSETSTSISSETSSSSESSSSQSSSSQEEAEVYSLVTTLPTVGSKVMFVAKASKGNYTMSKNHASNGNYREGSQVTISNNEITYSTNYGLFLVEEGSKSGTYSFYDVNNKKYLAAQTSSSNYLQLSATKDALSSFTVSSGKAHVIKAVSDSADRNTLRWNSQASRFSLYASTSNTGSNTDIELYEAAGEPVYATDFSADVPTSLAANKTHQINISYTPSNVNQKNLTFTSSNKDVATVSSTGIITPVATGSTTIKIELEGETSLLKKEYTLSITEAQVDDYTILIYICGSDLESDYNKSTKTYASLATENITEILSVANKPAGVNIVLETGGASAWNTKYGVESDKLGRYHVENQKLVKDASLTNASMGLTSTFQSFIEWGLETYPAKKTGLVLWNHGGALDGCCYDENFNDDALTPTELTTGLKNAYKNLGMSGQKLEWVGYDCCLMEVQNIAKYNSEYFNYMVASEESEPGAGWDYDGWLDDLYKNVDISTPALLSEISNTFVEKCRAEYQSYADYYYNYYQQYGDQEALEYYNYYNGYNDATLSVLDLSKVDAYVTAFESVASSLKSIIGTNSTKWNTFTNCINNGLRFGMTYDDDDNEIYPFDVFDVKVCFEKVKANSTFSSLDISGLLSALSDLVIYNAYGASYTETSGLTFVCTISGYNYTSILNDGYFPTWYNLVKTFVTSW